MLQPTGHRHLASKRCGSPPKAWLWIFLFSFCLTLGAFGSGQGCTWQTLLVKDLSLPKIKDIIAPVPW